MALKMIQKPRALWISGRPSKFMPKKPVTRFNGRKIAVSTVRVRMISLVRWLCAEKCIWTAFSAIDSSRRTWVRTRSMCSSTSRERTRSSSRSRSVA